MSEYVDIRTSTADIISIASRLRSQGAALEQAATGTGNEIEQLENRAETFPPDQFTDQFLEKYHAPTEYTVGERTLQGPANAAVRATAAEMGRRLSDVGGWVGQAMFSYAAENEQNATDISNAPRG
jgi:hypothetical protein